METRAERIEALIQRITPEMLEALEYAESGYGWSNGVSQTLIDVGKARDILVDLAKELETVDKECPICGESRPHLH